MPSHQDRVRQNYCIHSWYLSYDNYRDLYYYICHDCDKIITICKSDNGNTPKNLSELITQALNKLED